MVDSGSHGAAAITQHVGDIPHAQAKRIVSGRFSDGDRIIVDVSGEVFSFEWAPEPVSA